MKRLLIAFALLAAASVAGAAPNLGNATQKGSALIFPDIRVDDDAANPLARWNTLIRIANDASQDIDVKCFWMDGNKHRVDFGFLLTRNQAFWFDARTGRGTFQINPFPNSLSSGIDNPFLITPPAATEAADGSGLYRKGLLACWAVDAGQQNQVKWNHMSGTATLYNPVFGAYEYNAHAFFVPIGLDREPVGVAGTMNLNGVEYDSCPQFQIGQFTPAGPYNPAPQPPFLPSQIPIRTNRLVVAGCSLDFRQDYLPVYTKLDFEVWNEDEVKFTGAYECANSWHETELNVPPTANAGGGIDAAAQNFQWSTLQTYSARYRFRGVASTQCNIPTATPPVITQNVGVIAVQASSIDFGPPVNQLVYTSNYEPTDPPSGVPPAGPNAPPNVFSHALIATATSEVGDHIGFSLFPQQLVSGVVTFSSWACQQGHWTGNGWNVGPPAGPTNPCLSAPGSTFNLPITLNIYAVNPGPTVGPLVATVTTNFAVPFRPTADPTCPALDGTLDPNVFEEGRSGIRWRSPLDNECYYGYAFNVPFTFPPNTQVPQQVIWTVTYAPNVDLNVGIEQVSLTPAIGTDIDVNSFFRAVGPGGFLCDFFAVPNGTLRNDVGCWTGFRPMASFIALAAPAQAFGTSLATSGRVSGKIQWDPFGTLPEGGIR